MADKLISKQLVDIDELLQFLSDSGLILMMEFGINTKCR